MDFSPSGRILSGPETRDPFSFETVSRLSSRFTTTLLRTTAARPFLSHEFSAEHDRRYDRDHPFRILAWLDFMKEVGTLESPKFVFAHILKPHWPYSFDKYGNVTFHFGGWSDDHDPTVPGAFYGQIIWLNARMLEVIDAILDDYEEPPIMVIAGDHGHKGSSALDWLMTYSLRSCFPTAARAPYIRQSPPSTISEQYWTTTSNSTSSCWRTGSILISARSHAYSLDARFTCGALSMWRRPVT